MLISLIARFKKIWLPVLLFSLSAASHCLAQPDNKNIGQADRLYEAGQQAYQNGNTENAIKLWFDGYLAAREAGAPDPRLGVSFIRAVAADSIVKYYDTASMLYYWGMDTKHFEKYQDVLENELRRLQILLPPKSYNELRQTFSDGNPDLAADIRATWNRGDPSPSTRTNERLIEHWQRIAHARKTYPGNDPTYGTDDRGLTYIRYGSPDVIHDGIFSTNGAIVRNNVARIIDVKDYNNELPLGSPATERAVARAAFLASSSRPPYEIWMYEKELRKTSNSATSDNLVVIFGPDEGRGRFKRLDSPAELFPSEIFGQRSTIDIPATPSGLNTGLIAQHEIFRQFSPIDEYFTDGLEDIESALFSSRVIGGFTGQNFKDQLEFNLSRLETIAGPQASSLPAIELRVESYRFLDEADKPYHIAVLHSFPQKYLAVNQKGYNYRHVFRLHTARETIAKEIDSPPVNFQTIEGNTPLPTHSQFRIPRQPDSLKMEFAAEYYIPRGSTGELILTAAGKRTPDPPIKLLSTDPSRLEAADLVVGYTTETEPRGYFPFRVAYQNKIPATRDLVFHFEVYHLQPEATGIAKFQLMYELRKEGNLVQRLFGDEQQQGRLTLNFETRATRFAENITVETSNLEPGSYSLNIQITQAGSGPSIERELTFEIVG